MKKELRMYVLVPYNLSPIQQGIQAAHAIAEYSINAGYVKVGEIEIGTSLYKDWVKEHKTIVILNAGTTGKYSSMEAHANNLEKLKVKCSYFREPDLNDAMTAIAFVVDMKEDSHIVGYLKQMRLA